MYEDVAHVRGSSGGRQRRRVATVSVHPKRFLEGFPRRPHWLISGHGLLPFPVESTHAQLIQGHGLQRESGERIPVSDVRPFRGLRPRPDLASQVAAPPYDVLDAAEARQMAEGNPISFLRVNKAELEFPEDADPHGAEVYDRARANLEAFHRDGVLIQDPSPCFYVYRLTMGGQRQTGLVTATSVDEYDRGLIKKHEHTRPVKVADRATHIQTLDAQVGPVFSTYRSTDPLRDAFGSATSIDPDVSFEVDGVGHELWVVSDAGAVEAFRDGFGALPCLYIADGHHRSEAASEVARRERDANPGLPADAACNFFLNVLFPHDELRILPYNRVVADLAGKSIEAILDEVGGAFEVTPSALPVEPTGHYEYGVYVPGQWYRLRVRDGVVDLSSPDGIDRCGRARRSRSRALAGDHRSSNGLTHRFRRRDPRHERARVPGRLRSRRDRVFHARHDDRSALGRGRRVRRDAAQVDVVRAEASQRYGHPPTLGLGGFAVLILIADAFDAALPNRLAAFGEGDRRRRSPRGGRGSPRPKQDQGHRRVP